MGQLIAFDFELRKQIIYLIVCCVGCVFSIIAYGTYRCRNAWFEDPLTKSIIGENKSTLSHFLDGWGVLHFWFFAVISYLCPRLIIPILLVGIIWEGIEMQFKDRPFYLLECDIPLSDQKDGWWYGRWQDIVMNALGMAAGLYILKRTNLKPTVFVYALIVIIGIHVML